MPKLISIGELIDQSIDLFRRHFSELLGLSSLLLITGLLSMISLVLYPSASTLKSGAVLSISENIGVSLFALTNYVITPIISLLVFIALLKSISGIIQNRSLTFEHAIKQSKALFFPVLTTTLMVVFTIVVSIIAGMVPGALIAAIGSLLHWSFLIIIANILILFGIFAALYFAVRGAVEYYLAPFITTLDNTKGKAALDASHSLVNGRFWHTLIRIALPKILFLVLGVFLMFIINTFMNVLVGASTTMNLDTGLRIGTILNTILPIIIAALINPLIVIADVLLLQSLQTKS